MIVTFTGTRDGTTRPQRNRLIEEMKRACIDNSFTSMHGCCHGADQEFHEICAEEFGITVFEFYPSSQLQYAFASREAGVAGHRCIIHPIMKPLLRDDIMARRGDLMFAAPSTMEEIIRSGTWATIRYRKKYQKPLTIIFPDESIEVVEYPKPQGFGLL